MVNSRCTCYHHHPIVFEEECWKSSHDCCEQVQQQGEYGNFSKVLIRQTLHKRILKRRHMWKMPLQPFWLLRSWDLQTTWPKIIDRRLVALEIASSRTKFQKTHLRMVRFRWFFQNELTNMNPKSRRTFINNQHNGQQNCQGPSKQTQILLDSTGFTWTWIVPKWKRPLRC